MKGGRVIYRCLMLVFRTRCRATKAGIVLAPLRVLLFRVDWRKVYLLGELVSFSGCVNYGRVPGKAGSSAGGFASWLR